MMPQDKLFGVESDEKSERKYFKVPKIVGNGVDLSKLQLRINYQNASKIPSGKDMYIVKDATVYNDEWVYFSWELSRKVTQYKGNIYFIVCAVKADSKGNITNEWNTTLAEGKVLEGLEVETNQEQQYQASDYLEQLKQQLLDYSKEIKDTFPSDYTAMSEDVKNLQSDVKKLDDNKITKFYASSQGETHLADSDNGKIMDMMIYGKSSQDGTPTPENPVEIKSVANPTVKMYGKNLLNATLQNRTFNGVTFTNNGDGTYTLNGTASDRATFAIAKVAFDAYKTYRLTGWNSLISSIQDKQGIYVNGVFKFDPGTGINFKVPKSEEYAVIAIISQGTLLNNIVIKPMVTLDLTATYDDFEPYHEQTVTLPYTLNAIPVSSGGNATIDGQQYIADYVDVEKGVLVRNMACGNTLDMFHIDSINKGDAKWWDSSVSDMVDMRQNSGYKFSSGIAVGLFSKLKSYSFNEFYNKKIAMGIMNDQQYLIINMPKSYGLTTKQKWEDFLRDCKILRLLETPVEINLTQDQIEAFKALSTYYPKTYIDAESEQLEAYTMFNYPVSMEKGWEYVKQQIGDTRKYVYDMDTKLTETEASTLEAKIDTAILSEMIGD